MTTSTSTSPFASNLRAALAECQMTQEQLAREIGITLGAVNAWARGKSEPAGSTLVDLARVLGRDAEWFFTAPGTEGSPA